MPLKKTEVLPTKLIDKSITNNRNYGLEILIYNLFNLNASCFGFICN